MYVDAINRASTGAFSGIFPETRMLGVRCILYLPFIPHISDAESSDTEDGSLEDGQKKINQSKNSSIESLGTNKLINFQGGAVQVIS